jgi:hypothetical protein
MQQMHNGRYSGHTQRANVASMQVSLAVSISAWWAAAPCMTNASNKQSVHHSSTARRSGCKHQTVIIARKFKTLCCRSKW